MSTAAWWSVRVRRVLFDEPGAERDGINKVFTLDHRDFGVYRPAKLGRFSIVP